MRAFFAILIALLCLGPGAVVDAAPIPHPAVATVAIVDVKRDGRVEITIFHDAIAFVLNDTSARIGDPAMYEFLKAPPEEVAAACDDGRSRLLVGLKVVAGGGSLPIEPVDVPTPETFERWKSGHPGHRLPCKLESLVAAQLPRGARTMTLRFPEILSEVLVELRRPGIEPVTLPLTPAEVTPELDVSAAWTQADAPASTPPQATDRPNETAAGAARGAPGADAASPSTGPSDAHLGIFARFVRLGFLHIIPKGPDHVLFVFGLFLLSPRAKPVLAQITAFTIAHTITLTLTSLKIVGLPAGIVEPTIALSIAFIGVENLCTKKVHSWRPVVAFIFGLVHGMGVATAFTEHGFPSGSLIQSLLAFTVGVEGGHLVALAAAFALLGWTRGKPWYRRRVAIPLSVAISAIAIYWTFQRLFGIGF